MNIFQFGLTDCLKENYTEMQKANTTVFYWLGSSIGKLSKLLQLKSPTIRLLLGEYEPVKDGLNLLIQLDILPICNDAAKKMLTTMESIFSIERQEQKEDVLIAEKERGQLQYSIFEFQSVLNTELPRINFFFVNPLRAYDMTTLVNNGENVLSFEALDALGQSKDEVIKDIREAAKCLAFEISTAVGFHIYRAMEAIIVKDYFPTIGISPSEWEKNKNLGAYIKLLEGKKVDTKITGMLGHIKDNYRNPVMHPEEFWDSEKSESAFGLANSIITSMVRDIQNLKSKSGISTP